MIQASRAENEEKAQQLEENQKILNETLQSLARYFLLIFFSKSSKVFPADFFPKTMHNAEIVMGRWD